MNQQLYSIDVSFLIKDSCKEFDELIEALKKEFKVKSISEIPDEIGGLVPFFPFQIDLSAFDDKLAVATALETIKRLPNIVDRIQKVLKKKLLVLSWTIWDKKFSRNNNFMLKFENLNAEEIINALSSFQAKLADTEIFIAMQEFTRREDPVCITMTYNKDLACWEVENIWQVNY